VDRKPGYRPAEDKYAFAQRGAQDDKVFKHTARTLRLPPGSRPVFAVLAGPEIEPAVVSERLNELPALRIDRVQEARPNKDTPGGVVFSFAPFCGFVQTVLWKVMEDYFWSGLGKLILAFPEWWQ
jgi:hypothetical protein